MEIFKIDNLTLEYEKNKPIIENISLTINENEFVSIIGPNGCGKSTLIKSLAKIMPYKKSLKNKYINFVLKTNLKKFYSNNKIKEFELFNFYSENNKELKIPFLLNLKNNIYNNNFFKKFISETKKNNHAKKINEISNSLKMYGKIYFKNKDLYSYKNKEYAKSVSYVPQIVDFPTDVTVYEFVKMGRFPHTNFFKNNSKENEEIVNKSISLVGLDEYKFNFLNDLSGGQKQRALLALSLAQDTEVIILDEPTNHLDIRYQLEIIHLLHDLNHNHNKTIILVIHDINHAMKFSDRMIVMKDGQIKYFDKTEKIVNQKIIKEIFGVNAEIIESQGKKIISDYWIDDLKKLKEYHEKMEASL